MWFCVIIRIEPSDFVQGISHSKQVISRGREYVFVVKNKQNSAGETARLFYNAQTKWASYTQTHTSSILPSFFGDPGVNCSTTSTLMSERSVRTHALYMFGQCRYEWSVFPLWHTKWVKYEDWKCSRTRTFTIVRKNNNGVIESKRSQTWPINNETRTCSRASLSSLRQ